MKYTHNPRLSSRSFPERRARNFPPGELNLGDIAMEVLEIKREIENLSSRLGTTQDYL